MCKYASFILTKDNCFWLPKSESHEEIIKHFQLCESDSTGMRVNIVRIEISPVKIFSDLSKWIYKVDQDRVPEWYDAKECEERTRKELKKKVDKKILSIFVDLDKFLLSIPKTRFFKPDASPMKSWKIFYRKSWAAAWAAARAAARDAWDAKDAAWADAADAAWDARDAAWATERDAAWATARDAASATARDAARDAARAAARDAWDARDAAWATARDAALMARVILCKGLKLDAKHIRHAKERLNVWKKGYGLFCDVNGVLYVYAKK